jgi:hypothetical protein
MDVRDGGCRDEPGMTEEKLAKTNLSYVFLVNVVARDAATGS